MRFLLVALLGLVIQAPLIFEALRPWPTTPEPRPVDPGDVLRAETVAAVRQNAEHLATEVDR